MKISTKSWLSLLMVGVSTALVPTCAGADCHGRAPGTLWNFEGKIGDEDHVRATLEFHQRQVFGTYFHASQLEAGPVEDLRLAGAVAADGKTIALAEFDASGAVVGSCAAPSPKAGRLSLIGWMTCDVIGGEWIQGSAARPFLLAQADSSPGTLAHRYAIAGAMDDAPVNENAWRFWDALRQRDRRAVAAQMAYPLQVRRIGAKAAPRPEYLEGATPEEFLANYDQILWPWHVQMLLRGLPRNIGANDRGIFLHVASDGFIDGAGAFMVFNAQGKVRAFFN